MWFADQNITRRMDSLELNFGGLEVQKLNIPTDRSQREDEKMR